jgi:ATP-dependent protease Clp ATPase subunit
MSSARDADSLRCSFCTKAQNRVGKLFSSPSDRPRAYICDECIAVCASIIEDDRAETDGVHPLLTHPLASKLMATIESWIRDEALGKDGSMAVAEVRNLAKQMMQDGAASRGGITMT